jgi:hypothetical protein
MKQITTPLDTIITRLTSGRLLLPVGRYEEEITQEYLEGLCVALGSSSPNPLIIVSNNKIIKGEKVLFALLMLKDQVEQVSSLEVEKGTLVGGVRKVETPYMIDNIYTDGYMSSYTFDLFYLESVKEDYRKTYMEFIH